MYVIERHILIGDTDNIGWLDRFGAFDALDGAMVFDTYEEAEKHFNPSGDPNHRNSNIKEIRWEIKSFPFVACPICGEEWSKDDMLLTYDCHGIPYRYVCPDCYDKAMDRGYDGEYYTEADENIW